MAAHQYELLKCEGCGKKLGYIYVSVKDFFFGLAGTRYWLSHGPPTSIEKSAFCESCFQKRIDETSENRLKPISEKDKSAEPQPKRKGRPLVR